MGLPKGVALRSLRPLGVERRQEVVACALAVTAGLSTHPAVFVMLGMPFALVPAEPARLNAGLKRRPRHLRVERRLPRQYLAGSGAYAGTVEVQTDTANHRLYILLTKAGVGARGAGLFAVKAGLNALHQRPRVNRSTAWVRLKHSPSMITQDLPPFGSYSLRRSTLLLQLNNRCEFRVNRFR